jgi:site-specific DNA recombinase
MSAPAVVYVRQSLDRSGDGDAVERQRKDCEALARARGWAVVEVAQDNDTSAAGGKRRPGFELVLKAIESGRVQAVIAWDLSRLTRNARDRLRLIEAGRAAGATIALCRGSDLDLSTPAGRLTADILASVAQHEIEQKGDRQRRANEQRRGRGEALWTHRPFGYDRDDDGRVVVVHREAAVIRWAALWVRTGTAREPHSLSEAVRRLDARGITTTTGGPWSVNTLRRSLLNPRVTGTVTHLGLAVAPGTWPTILDDDVQQQVAEILRDPSRRKQTSTNLRHLLSGSCRCGVCGGKMFAQMQGPMSARVPAYVCRQSTHVSRFTQPVDEYVEAVIVGRLSRSDAVELLSPNVDLDGLRREATGLRERRDALAAMLSDGLLSATAVREQAGRLTRALATIEARLDAAVNGSPLAPLVTAPDVLAVWAAMPVRARRDVVDILATVTILPTGKGGRFTTDTVIVEWKTA